MIIFTITSNTKLLNSLKKIFLTLFFFLTVCPSYKANPIALTYFSELYFDSTGWKIELQLSYDIGHVDTLTGWHISTISGTADIISDIILQSGPIVITVDDLSKELFINPLGDSILIFRKDSIYPIDQLIFGNVEGAVLPAPKPHQSICKINSYNYYFDNSPTIGLPNDAENACGTIKGIIRDIIGTPFPFVRINYYDYYEGGFIYAYHPFYTDSLGMFSIDYLSGNRAFIVDTSRKFMFTIRDSLKFFEYLILPEDTITLDITLPIKYYNANLDYLPMAIGNYWEYANYSQDYYPPFKTDSSFYSVEIIGDTLLENRVTYKIFEQDDLPNNEFRYHYYIRIDSISGSVYKFIPTEGEEIQIDSLFCKAGDHFKGRQFAETNESGFIVCLSVDSILFFSEKRQRKTFDDLTIIPAEYYEKVKGIGFNFSQSCEFGCGTTILRYAKLNGKEYGKQIITEVIGKKLLLNFSLSQNFPNPFNPTTKIKYSIPVETLRSAEGGTSLQNVTLKIYDILGNEVATLVNEEKPAGEYEVEFNGCNLSSGIYFYKLQAGKFVQTKKLILLK